MQQIDHGCLAAEIIVIALPAVVDAVLLIGKNIFGQLFDPLEFCHPDEDAATDIVLCTEHIAAARFLRALPAAGNPLAGAAIVLIAATLAQMPPTAIMV